MDRRRTLGVIAVLGIVAIGATVLVHRQGSSARPRPASAVVGDYRRAHATFDEDRAVLDRAVARGASIRRAAGGCMPDWRAAPEDRRNALLDLYRVAAAQPSLSAEIAAARGWLAAVDHIDDLDRVPRLVDARLRLARAVRALEALRRVDLDACTTVRVWRRARWSPRREPMALSRVRRALAMLSVSHAHVPLVDVGVPEALDACEPVFETLAPEDSFCG
jgi:hypothetical protein